MALPAETAISSVIAWYGTEAAQVRCSCTTVASDNAADQAVKRAWLQDFGTQVVQALQRRILASSK